MIDIKGLSKGAVLAALYNNSTPLGMGWLQADGETMSEEEAEVVLGKYRNVYGNKTAYFDYLKGRVIKVDLSGDRFDPALYDRDNGQGAAERVVASLRSVAA